MSSRVIQQFSKDHEEAVCGLDDCANRWCCALHAAMAADSGQPFKPRAELVFAALNATLTCHDYCRGKGERDGGSSGR